MSEIEQNIDTDPPLIILGWREWLSLSELGIARIKTKIDTGDRSSSLHSYDIECFERDSCSMVRFKAHPVQRKTLDKMCWFKSSCPRARAGVPIPPDSCSDVSLPISESYSGISLKIPIRIQRGPEDGPVVIITAVLHGDELKGTGAVRELICDQTIQRNGGIRYSGIKIGARRLETQAVNDLACNDLVVEHEDDEERR